MTLGTTTHSEHALEPWVCLHRGHAAVRRSVAAKLQVAHGLTVNDFEALVLLARADGHFMRRVDLANALQLTASGVTRLLDGLEEQGLVRKKACSTDGRVTYAVLTKAGQRRLEKASSAHAATIKALFEKHYTPRELALLAELLARLPEAVPAGSRRMI
jgi:MarR family transcriptional regulator, 2-MHQ and catechol-resistance regulon repressor